MNSSSSKLHYPSSRYVIAHKLQEKDVKTAKRLAKSLLNTYDKDKNGVLCRKQIIPMMQNAYKKWDKNYKPTEKQIQSYSNMLDKNGDGKITLVDLQETCKRYLGQRV